MNMSFSIYKSNIILCSGDSILVYNLENKEESILTLPKLQSEKDIRAHNNEDIDSFHTLTSVDFSNDGKYFLVCANRKQLCLFKTEGYELISNRTMARAASRVRFIPNNDIIVADKSGDAYLFSTSQPNQNGQLLLGHLSMLLDIMVTEDEKYVISADRDEKIRISFFPSSYNILSYCLGHKNFVTNVAVLPHDKNVLVSSGGDGTLMFWNFQTGKELQTVYFHEKLSQDDLVKLIKTLKENDLDDEVTVSPVKHLQLLQISDIKSVIVVTFYCSNAILVYSVSNKIDNLGIEYLELITVPEEPLECKAHTNQLWILTSTKIYVYKFEEKGFIHDVKLDSVIDKLNDSWMKLYSASIQTLLPVLYKRKFDNVQEYQERKKSRLIK